MRILSFLAFFIVWPVICNAQSTIVDSSGREISVPDKIERIVAAGLPAAIMIYTLAPERMIGWPCALTDQQKKFITSPFAELPIRGRLVPWGSPNCPLASMAAISSLKPDLIVDAGDVKPRNVEEAKSIQSQLRVPFLLLDTDLEDLAASYRTLGRAIGATARADELAKEIELMTRKVREAAASLPAGNRPRIYVGRGAEGLLSGLAGSDELIRMVGAENVVPDAGKGRPVYASSEALLAWDPDIIVLESQQLISDLDRRGFWRHLRAVKNGRVYRIPQLPLDWLDNPRSVNRLMGLHWLEHICFSARSGTDLQEIASGFYEKFYGFKLGRDHLSELFESALLEGGK